MENEYTSTIPKALMPYKLPNNWRWFFWKDLMLDYQQGLIRRNSELGSGNVFYIKMGDIDDKGNLDDSDLAETNASESEINNFELRPGDFLINVRNSREWVGKTCVVRKKLIKPMLFNHMIVKVKHRSIKMNYYLNAFLNIPSSKELLDRIKTGTTTIIALYQRDLNHLPIPLPDKITFNAIVSFYKTLDDKIELNNQINAELEEMAKTIYDYWFVQFDFPNQEGKPYKSSGGKMVYNKKLKGEIPEGWEVKSFEEIIEELKSGSWGKEKQQGNYSERIYCIRGADINALNGDGEIDAPERFVIPKHLDKALNANDFVIEMSGGSPTQSTGRMALLTEETFKRFDTSVLCSNFCKAISLKDEKLIFNFFQEWNRLYNADVMFQFEGKTSGIKNLLFNSVIKSCKMVIPSEDLINNFYKISNDIEKKREVNLRQNQELSTLRDWLLPMLMNGQVSVTSAEEMLEELNKAAEPEQTYN